MGNSGTVFKSAAGAGLSGNIVGHRFPEELGYCNAVWYSSLLDLFFFGQPSIVQHDVHNTFSYSFLHPPSPSHNSLNSTQKREACPSAIRTIYAQFSTRIFCFMASLLS